jgi:hypothetical protein
MNQERMKIVILRRGVFPAPQDLNLKGLRGAGVEILNADQNRRSE